MFTTQTRVKNLRREAFFADNDAVMKERDHAGALKAEFDVEIQVETFLFNHTLSIEGITCEKTQYGFSRGVHCTTETCDPYHFRFPPKNM